MPSWQNNLLYMLPRLYGFLFYRTGEFNVEYERRVLDMLGRLSKPMAPIQCMPTRVNGIPAEWITPESIALERTILYLHGGAFNSGSIVSHRSLVANIATACKARALVIDYRLAPEHPYPGAFEDCLAAYEWLLASGIPAKQIAVMGDSAGGTLTLTLLVHLRELSKPLPALAVCISPATDLSTSGRELDSIFKKDHLLNPKIIDTWSEMYLRDADPQSPLVSPLYADLRGLPPLLIQAGSSELLLSDVTRFVEKAREADVPVTFEVWDGMQHVWQFAAPILPEGRQAIMRIGEFVDRLFAHAPS